MVHKAEGPFSLPGWSRCTGVESEACRHEENRMAMDFVGGLKNQMGNGEHSARGFRTE